MSGRPSPVRQRSLLPSRMASKYSVEIEKGVESLINCLICTEPYADPKVLTCQHTFCTKCLKSYHENYNQQRIIKGSNFPCPSCRKMVYLPQGGIDSLPKDFKVGQIQEFFDKINIIPSSSEETNGLMCDVCRYECKKAAAEKFCMQCGKYLCTGCGAQHDNNPLFASHSSMTVDSPNVTILECQEHHEEIKYYCTPCAAALCTVCALGKHSKHDIADLPTALERKRTVISGNISQLKSYMTQYQEKAENLGKLSKEQTTSASIVRAAVQSHTTKCIEILHKQEGQLLDNLERGLSFVLHAIKAEQDAIQKRVNSLDAICKEAGVLLDGDQALELLATAKTMTSRLDKVLSQPPDSISSELQKKSVFTPKTEIEIGSVEWDGEVVGAVGGEPKADQHISGIKLDIIAPEITCSKSVPSSPACGPADCGVMRSLSESAAQQPVSTCREGLKLLWKTQDNSETHDVAFMPDGSVVTTEYKLGMDKIQVYDVNGMVRKNITPSSPSKIIQPWGITINTQACNIIVTDHGDSSIKFLDTDLNVNQTWRRLFDKPSGIAVMRTGEYVISDTGERNTNKISVFLPNGIRVRDFGAKGTEDGQFLCPNYLTVDHNDRIIISDAEQHCVKVLDRMGKQLFQFSHSQSTSKPMEPQGVTVDSQNNIVVADHASRSVSMYSPEGRFIQKIIEIDSAPWGISLHGNGLLAVTSDPSLNMVQVPVFKAP